ncbi:MAG: hypothetical protein AAGF23_08420, partial [Acidobacteriota bacterium]
HLELRRYALLADVSAANCRRRSAPGRGLEQLDAVVAEALELELFVPELRARALRAQVLTDLGRGGDARRELADLRSRAAERGFPAAAAAGGCCG